MRFLCPRCYEPIVVQDELVGHKTICPLCSSEIVVPPLYGPSASFISGTTERPQDAPGGKLTGSEGVATNLNDERKNDLTSSGRSISVPLSAHWIQWVPAVSLGLVVVLTLFFDWNGAFPGGHAVYTQGAFRALFGRIHIDPDGENVFKANPVNAPEGQVALKDQVRSNWLMLLIIPLLFLSFGSAVLVAASPEALLRHVPPALQPLLASKMLLVAALSGAAFVLLAIQAIRGFGLENAIRENARAEVEKTQKLPDYPSESDYKRREILEGSLIGRFQVQQTMALKLIFLLLLLTVAASLYNYFLTDRKSSSVPRLELHW